MTLDVPYYSQLQDTRNKEWQETACGIASLKMVMDFYIPTHKSIDQIYQTGLDLNGFLKNVGWYHHILVMIAKQFGFKGILRSWQIPADKILVLENRGFSENDIQMMKDQLLDEGIFELKRLIEQNHPVIVSVKTNFVPSGIGHLAVLLGFENDQLIFNDPYDRKRPGKKVSVSLKDFLKVWSRRVIIIQPN